MHVCGGCASLISYEWSSKYEMLNFSVHICLSDSIFMETWFNKFMSYNIYIIMFHLNNCLFS